jgi:hypothetical protein
MGEKLKPCVCGSTDIRDWTEDDGELVIRACANRACHWLVRIKADEKHRLDEVWNARAPGPETKALIGRIKELLAKAPTDHLMVKGGWDDANVNQILTPGEAAALIAEHEAA